MKIKTLIFLIILLSGCGQIDRNITIEPSAKIYVDEWNDLYPNNTVNVDIVKGDLSSSGAVGDWDGYQITIDSNYWNKLRDLGRQQLIWHELGHAMFNYKHDWGTTTLYDDVGQPHSVERSIMYPFVFGDDEIYAYFHSYYETQLGSCQTCDSNVNGDGTTFRRSRVSRID